MPKQKTYKLPRPYAKLGAYLAAGRNEKNLTQRHMQKRLAYSSAQFISNFERGLAKPPIPKLREFIEIYDLNPKKVMRLIIKVEAEKIRSGLGI